MKEKIEDIKKLIADGNILAAINALKLIDSFNADEIFMLESRFKQSERERRRGTIDLRDSDLTRNQVVQSLVEVISKIQDDEVNQDRNQNRKKVIEKKLVLEIIKSQRKSIRIYAIVSTIPIFIASSFVIWSICREDFGIIQTLGSLLIGSLSGFPIKEMVIRIEKVSVLNLLALKIEELVNKTYNQEEVEKVNNIFWNILENSLLKS